MSGKKGDKFFIKTLGQKIYPKKNSKNFLANKSVQLFVCSKNFSTCLKFFWPNFFDRKFFPLNFLTYRISNVSAFLFTHWNKTSTPSGTVVGLRQRGFGRCAFVFQFFFLLDFPSKNISPQNDSFERPKGCMRVSICSGISMPHWTREGKPPQGESTQNWMSSRTKT